MAEDDAKRKLKDELRRMLMSMIEKPIPNQPNPNPLTEEHPEPEEEPFDDKPTEGDDEED